MEIQSLFRILINSIPVCGWIKETAKVYMVVIPQHAGSITSYTPIVNGYMTQSKIYQFPA